MLRLALLLSCLAAPLLADQPCCATGDLGLVVERATGTLLVIDRSDRAAVGRVEGLGDISHASLTYSPDERYAFVFGRDGGLSKVDMLTREVVARTVQAGNSIGGAISDDGTLVAVSNYEPGGVKVFDAGTLELVADIPAAGKTIGLVDVPGRRFAWTVWDTGEAFLGDFSGPEPVIAALGNAAEDLPVYKMPHLQGWAFTEGQYVLPAVGAHELLWVDRESLLETARTPMHGQPVFIIAQPGSPYVWVNFATPLNDVVQVVDSRTHQVVKTLTPGKAVLHMEFAPRGAEVWLSLRDDNKVVILDTRSFAVLGEVAAESPSGIFFTARAHRTGL
jgi:protein NirF